MLAKSSTSSLFALAALALAATAQTTQTSKPATASHTATHTTAAGGCMKLPEISPKVPALPAGTSCPKALFTITPRPSVTIDYQSPIIVGDNLADTFNAKPKSITLGYVDIKVGAGELAKPHMYYTVQYTGYLTDGTKFDSSVDHGEPITFPYGERKVIAGWDTGFEGMRVGGKRRIFVPYQLAYGEAGKPPTIPAKSELIFDLELISQSSTPPEPKPKPAPPTPPTPPAAKPAPAPATPPAASGTPAPTK